MWEVELETCFLRYIDKDKEIITQLKWNENEMKWNENFIDG